MTERGWRAIAFTLYFALGATWSLLMPMWEGPDEPAHYVLALTLARSNEYQTLDRNYEAHQPQLYYRLASLPLKILQAQDPESIAYVRPYPYFRFVRQPVRIFDWNDENYQFLPGPQLLRWLNLLLGAGALWVNDRSARSFVQGGRLRTAALLLAALTPQYLHISSAVNNDAFAALAGALLFALLARVWFRPPGWAGSFLAVLLGIVVPLTTKLSVLPMGLSVIAAVFWVHREALWTQRIRWLAGGAAAAALIGAGFYLASPQMARLIVEQILWRALTVRPDAFQGSYLWPVLAQIAWSFWGKVGWLAVGLPGAFIAGLTALAFAGALADVRAPLRQPADPEADGPRRRGWGWLWVAAGLAVLAILKNGLTTPNSQGRFLFPALGPLTLVVASGWSRLLPERLRPYLPHLVLAVMLGLNLWLWLSGVLPVYYQPWFD